jgi:pimeloyl-ACP methyl ester carboxylesterase
VLPLAGRLAEAGLHTIVFSRPGYLGTPLSVGRTFAEQADAAMALLDFLRIDTAAVVGVSGGGPVALQIALRHSQRTTGLAMIAAVTFEKPDVAAAAANPPGWRADLTALAASFRPDFALRLLASRIRVNDPAVPPTCGCDRGSGRSSFHSRSRG